MKALLRHPILLAVVIAQLVLMTNSSAQAGTIPEQASMISSGKLFDYFSWTADATWKKIEIASIGIPDYLTQEQQKLAVHEYIDQTRNIESAESDLNKIYADPSVKDKDLATESLRTKLDGLTQQQNDLAPIAEAIIQGQVASVAADLGLTVGGQPIPSVLYHVSALPLALIVSPVNKIEQEANISLVADLTVEDQDQLEQSVDDKLGVSSLIVPVGGIGAYPTMVMQTSDLKWLTEVVAHEWTHNFLTYRPLGIRYEVSPELRTMNETTASIAGKEIGAEVIATYYPELLTNEFSDPMLISTKSQPIGPGSYRQPFDFRKEMHETRVTVDQLLSEGKVTEADSYMEQRREYFWKNGYPLRKLNQAYFAFYGAYADVPGGAAGEDPVGPAVRTLREQSLSLADFLYKISRMTSFGDLQKAVSN